MIPDVVEATVRRVARTEGYAYCDFGSVTDFPCRYSGPPPPPLSVVRLMRFEGEYVVLGPVGDVRQLFHDDFLYVKDDVAKRTTRASTSLASASTSWHNVDTALDIVLPAAAGDVIEASVSAVWDSQAVQGYLDVQCVASGNYFGSAVDPNLNLGIASWVGFASVRTGVGPTFRRTLDAADIDAAGNVTLRLRKRIDLAVSKTLFAVAALPLDFFARNISAHGPGDTNWGRLPIVIPHLGVTLLSTGEVRAALTVADGVLQLRHAGVGVQVIGKTARSMRASADVAHWFSARVRINELGAPGENTAYIIGLYDNTHPYNGIQATYDYGDTNWRINETDITGTEAVAGEWVDIDAIAVADGFVAGWINGDGPYLGTTRLPTASTSYTPVLAIDRSTSPAGAEAIIDVDWCQVSTFPDFAHPDDLEATVEDEEPGAEQ